MIDVFLCDYIRTPFGRYAGSLSPVRADDLAAIPIRELMLRNPDADWAAVDDVYYGCVNQAGEDNRNVARMAALLAGLPVEVPGATINRLCGSGMNAVMSAVRAIAAGEAELMIAGGVESMSRAPFVMPKAGAAFTRRAEIYDTTIGSRFENPAFANIYGYEAMPVTAENVAADFGVSRADQDAFALRSQTRAAAAQTTGRLSREIVGVAVPQRRGGPVTVDQDEHIRPDTTLDSLAKLRAPFVENGTVTAGNASGVNDGAAAMILASESAVRKHGLIPRARYLGGAVAGVPPRIMGMGPVPATQKLCARIGLSPTEFEVIELNEAFAAQGLAVLRELGLPDDAEHINPNGGAIALGHPLGASGARITGTAVLELQERGGKRALATMCIGVGQGIAIAVEAV
ncbi:3-oxoadipyl-CoA thiolase [Cognatishimia sp. D5M38]|jgi:acetyl-CoA acyltransferase|uniref:Beta-ketoadipyl-CoA thiolase n=1 Tax=Cognatishimia coralii TaxID=3083254 RepID=A0ABU8QK49_9RHOB|nr:3-oxoadipyl-CoA thiolase [Donghicola eburneus]MCI5038172.1 3-oxoadipyl-CoA thiolase [Donghicola eburneus]